MNIPLIFWIVPAAAVIALAVAWAFYRSMKREDEGTPRMREIAEHVRKGAMAYLRQQYKVVLIVFIILALFFAYLAYGAGVQNPWVPFAFLTGGFFSGLAGYFGMKTATYASARTANAARQSLDRGLKVAFRSGAVMGLVVVGLGLLDISFWYIILERFVEVSGPQKLVVITTTMLTFGMGASTQALFARVGGGIYTKAADVGADLVGKVEAGIPEDDPRNPATIADNVGDNVGDVAGMGADLYESYCGSVLATAALGAAAFATADGMAMQLKAVLAPMLIAAVGIVLSIIGIFLVRTREGASMRELLRSLGVGVNFSSLLIAGATFGILYLLGIQNWLGLSCSVITGLVAGIIIGQATEYYTSHSYKPTQKIAGSAQTGPATVIIAGVGSGMISTAIPVLTIGAAIILAYLCAIGFDMEHMMAPMNMSLGLYGIGIAAVGMLSTLGITLATDAYGPIADNAGGNAEMSGLGPEVRKRTDALDALGNTTAATGKGFAIGSAALTALALLASYIEEIRIGLLHNGITMLDLPNGTSQLVEKASILDFMEYYQVSLMNPTVLIGIFIGAMMSFLFCGLTMNAVGRAAREHGERGAPPVPRDQGHPHGRRHAGLCPLRGDFDPRRTARDDVPQPAGHRRSGGCRSRIRRGRRDGLAGRRPRFGFRAGRVHGQCGRRVGQCQEDGRGGAFRRQRLRVPQGHRGGRHRRRPVQGHFGPVAQHPYQADVDGLHRHGRAYGGFPPLLMLCLPGGAGAVRIRIRDRQGCGRALPRLWLRLPAKALYWLRPAAKGDVPAPAAVK